jgi:hypothetical protein
MKRLHGRLAPLQLLAGTITIRKHLLLATVRPNRSRVEVRAMPIFRARIVNLPGYGEDSTSHKNGGWTRDKTQLKLGNYAVTIKQRKSALKFDGNEWRGKQHDTSTIFVSKVHSLQEGMAVVDDLCWLLSFAHSSRIQAYHYSYGKRAKGHGVQGTYNEWRPPFHSGVGRVSDFIQQTWPNYQKLKATRPLSAFIHLIGASDLGDGGLLEAQVSASVQCLESIKSYFALTEGARYKITEANDGQFLRGKKVMSFEKLLKLTLEDVGMKLPSSFETIRRLRNALVHRGFIRETDNVTKFIFNTTPARGMHGAMFGVMEDAHDILREFMLRLLGYKGKWCAYSHKEELYREIT